MSPWIGFSTSELALLLLLSAGPAPSSDSLEVRTDELDDEEHDDDDDDDSAGAGDILFDDEYRTMTLEKDLLWPCSRSLCRSAVGVARPLPPPAPALCEAMHPLLLTWPNGFFLHGLSWPWPWASSWAPLVAPGTFLPSWFPALAENIVLRR